MRTQRPHVLLEGRGFKNTYRSHRASREKRHIGRIPLRAAPQRPRRQTLRAFQRRRPLHNQGKRPPVAPAHVLRAEACRLGICVQQSEGIFWESKIKMA